MFATACADDEYLHASILPHMGLCVVFGYIVRKALLLLSGRGAIESGNFVNSDWTGQERPRWAI